VALDSDDPAYGGSGAGPRAGLAVEAVAAHGRAQSLALDLPPLATVFLVPA
jgi:1,4-alpha-glucan branching enzyme